MDNALEDHTWNEEAVTTIVAGATGSGGDSGGERAEKDLEGALWDIGRSNRVVQDSEIRRKLFIF